MFESFKSKVAAVRALTPGKVVCVGRNYAAHAKELNNPVPKEPVLFIKPSTSLVGFEGTFSIPDDGCHYEAEVAVIITKQLVSCEADDVVGAIGGIALALDLTKRELQAKLKEKSLPWELSKGFDGACPITEVIDVNNLDELDCLDFSLSIDGELKQHGNTREMLFPILPLVAHISSHFTLRPGDIVLTGTPKGVGPLSRGSCLELRFGEHLSFVSSVVSE